MPGDSMTTGLVPAQMFRSISLLLHANRLAPTLSRHGLNYAQAPICNDGGSSMRLLTTLRQRPTPRPRAAVSEARQSRSTRGQETSPNLDSVVSPSRLGKRKVALFVGYEGTEYRGLQKQAGTAPMATIEDQLEAAIFAAGGILPSNMGDTSKLRWSRSSRTDKSVHSLATIIAMKLECDPSSFEKDPDGIGLAHAINAHLPPTVKVFSVQRVTKKFDARRECVRRTYDYYVPASMLGVKGDDSAEERETLRLLSAAWNAFEGNHPFHNYTKRRLYREHANSRGRNRRWEAIIGGGECDAASEESEAVVAARQDTESDIEESRGFQGAQATSDSEEESLQLAADVDALGDSSEEETAQPRPRGKLEFVWKEEREAADPIVRRHYRFIEKCSADGKLVRLSDDGDLCVRLTVRGASFMLHQIRHMVGAAVAVALKRLPMEALIASLTTPARVGFPLAPPSTLVLKEAEFSPFRTSWDGKAAMVTQWSGDMLELRPRGRELQEAFARDFLLPAVSELLSGEEWDQWRIDLDRMWYVEEELKEWVNAARGWEEMRAVKRAERQAKLNLDADVAA